MSFLCKQPINYYILQGTEYEWLNISNDPSKGKRLKENIKFQINELLAISTTNESNRMNDISLCRLRNFITGKIMQYKAYNGEWY